MDTIETMEAFARVVDAGSFTEAARRWGRSKAVVSKYVAALEERLGVVLLQRTTRALHLTETGRAYYERATELLEELGELERSLSDAHRAPRGTLRLTAPEGVSDAFLDPIIARFLERCPEVQIDLQITNRMLDLVEEGIDLAIRVTEPRDSALITRRLGDAPIIACASPEYLARAGRPAHPRELSERPCIIDTNFRGGGRWRFREPRARAGEGEAFTVRVRGPVRVNSPIRVRELTARGLGIALIPELVARAAIAEGRLVRVLEGYEGYGWGIWAVWPSRRQLSGKVRAFVDALAEAFAHPRGVSPNSSASSS